MNFQSNPSALLVLSFVRALQDAGIYACIAGGAIRDIQHGQVPKDFDLWILPRTDGSIPTPEDVENAIAAAGLTPFADAMYDHKDYQAIRLDTVLKYDAAAIDIIWLNNQDGHPCQCVEEVLDRFDFSINQQALLFVQTSEGLQLSHVSKFDGVNVTPADLSTIETSRYARLQGMYPQYNWSAVANALDDSNWDEGIPYA